MSDPEHKRIIEAARLVLRADALLREALGELDMVTRNGDVGVYFTNITDARNHLANQFCSYMDNLR